MNAETDLIEVFNTDLLTFSPEEVTVAGYSDASPVSFSSSSKTNYDYASEALLY